MAQGPSTSVAAASAAVTPQPPPEKQTDLTINGPPPLDKDAPAPPSFEEAIASSTTPSHAFPGADPELGLSLPPDYFDVSIVPEQNVLHRANVA
ncbi:hypothetical protein HDU67_004847, partial [Dinochytrium kinnereticum]